MILRIAAIATLSVLSTLLTPALAAAAESADPAYAAERTLLRALDRLAADTGGALTVSRNPATRTPFLVQIPSRAIGLGGHSVEQTAWAFLRQHGAAFGIDHPESQLVLQASSTDHLGSTHLSYSQFHQAIPVLGAVLKLHFDDHGSLVTINGTTVPGIDIDPFPSLNGPAAGEIATQLVARRHGLDWTEPVAASTTLYVFRAGLARGITGSTHLVWEVEVTHPKPLRELVYIDAHDGSVVDHVEGIHSVRRFIHHYERPNPIWKEGDSLPFRGLETERRDLEVNNIIDISGATFDLFAHLSRGEQISYDARNGAMHSIYERTDHLCPTPNAAWDGESTNFCYGMVVDDVVAHEWVHAYTQHTHGLIYAYEPGALNESYSDIFGELVDLLSDGDFDDPAPLRSDGSCSTLGSTNSSTTLQVHTPVLASGVYISSEASGNPQPPWSVSGQVELVDDGVGATGDACEPLSGFTAGKIALLDGGGCADWEKMVNVRDAGAAAAIYINSGDESVGWVGGGALNPVPATSVGRSDGDILKAALAQNLTATIAANEANDESLRWLVGEGTVPFGAIRDLWNPMCFADPGSVRKSYRCNRTYGPGGIHSNSGIPNHAFALLVDGGTYDRRTVAAIGLTKAAHIYWRAMSTYQVPASGFAEHADYLELSCSDLKGAELTDLLTGEASAEVIDGFDCQQVATAMLAVSMRMSPVQCDFETVLEADPPPLWEDRVVYSETFDTDPGPPWERSNRGVNDGYRSNDWEWRSEVPGNGWGGAFFAVNGRTLGDCNINGDDQSGVMHLESPSIALPTDVQEMVLVFDHYVATEPEADGGNLKISVNGGSYRLVNTDAFLFNAYNDEVRDSQTANPLAGEPAFSGQDEGVVEGYWGQSQIDLGSVAEPGDTIRIRFDFGTNRCDGRDGWYIDNFRIVATWNPTRSAGRRIRPS